MASTGEQTQLGRVSSPIEDYALIGDCESAALVGRDGSIDWWCAPRFDSPACFAALLGTPEHGRWKLAPAKLSRARRASKVVRRYRGDTLVLETEYHSPSGTVAVIDFLPLHEEGTALIRIVEGRRGTVDHAAWTCASASTTARSCPGCAQHDGGLLAIGGPDSLRLRTPVPTRGEGLHHGGPVHGGRR